MELKTYKCIKDNLYCNVGDIVLYYEEDFPLGKKRYVVMTDNPMDYHVQWYDWMKPFENYFERDYQDDIERYLKLQNEKRVFKLSKARIENISKELNKIIKD